MQIFEVGGSLRNELLGLPAKDRDFAVLAQSYDEMVAYLLAQGCTIYQARPQFVSVKAKHPTLGAVDFTLARKESFYTDARHPDSVRPAETIEEDLARRDFTMNAMAREIGTTKIIDPFDGKDSIKRQVITCVGDPITRFNEDRLRVFRAIRFACQLNFRLCSFESRAIEYFTENDFEKLPKEMVQIEMKKAFEADSFRAMQLLLEFSWIAKAMFQKGIWLKPTFELKG